MVLTKPKILDNKKFKAAEPLLLRTAAFLLLFVLYSGLIGPKIISGGILYNDHFGFYGGLGKSALFGVLCLIILIYRKKMVRLKAWDNSNIIWILISLVSYICAWIFVNKLLKGNNELSNIIFSQVFLWLSLIFGGLGIFGPTNIKNIYNSYKKEIVQSVFIAFGFYILLLFIYSMWTYLAFIVIHSVNWLLNESGVLSVIIPPRGLLLQKFGINIAQYCSGIESIALFTGLYILVGVLDWDKFNHKKLIYIYPIALIFLFGLNILRVYLLIMAGYYINQQIAFSLFHTYAGMIFFILYSGFFWIITYRWLLVDANKKIKS